VSTLTEISPDGEGVWKITAPPGSGKSGPVHYEEDLALKNMKSMSGSAMSTWLHTCGHGGCSSGGYGVMTTSWEPTAGHIQWRLSSASEQTGEVRFGDDLWLKNMFSVQTYLDTCGQAAGSTCTSGHGVGTSSTPGGSDPTSKTGTWQFERTRCPQALHFDDCVTIKNMNAGKNGTYLATCGSGNSHCGRKYGGYGVSTLTEISPDGEGVWKITAPPGSGKSGPVHYEEDLALKNMKSMSGSAMSTWLHTCGHGGCSSGGYGVMTTSWEPTAGHIQWRLSSASEQTGEVRFGDDLWLKNMFSVQTYLDTCGQAAGSTCTSGHGVGTSSTPGGSDPTSKAGTWQFERTACPQ